MFKDLIWIKQNSLSESFCKNIIDKFEKSNDKEDGTFGDNTLDKSIKDTTELVVSNNNDWVDEDHILFDALQKGLEEYEIYLENISPACKPRPYQNFTMQDRGYKIQKYEPSGHYDWHNDWIIEDYFGTRVYVFMWYLNTIEAKDGGSTDFFDGTSLQPKLGSLVFFPATWTYVHRGRKTNVEKYICNGWIYHTPS
jgi:hypothetical protein|tara:strand:- start:78 stop:665 length:588 start_codon:yes stop_codon:yes gene_type:complete